MPNNYSKPDEVNVLPLAQMYAEDIDSLEPSAANDTKFIQVNGFL